MEENEIITEPGTDLLQDASDTENDGSDIYEAENTETDDAAEEEAQANTDYRGELLALADEFPELAGVEDITELENPLRYAALRDMGLTAKEAYLATSGVRRPRDNRAHLGGSVPRRAAPPAAAMSARELRAARELFSGVSDTELVRLYKRVTGN